MSRLTPAVKNVVASAPGLSTMTNRDKFGQNIGGLEKKIGRKYSNEMLKRRHLQFYLLNVFVKNIQKFNLNIILEH
jgi:hypothetical protein